MDMIDNKLFVLTDIDHTKTKDKNPQSNGICERLHETILEEFYSVSLRKMKTGGLP